MVEHTADSGVDAQAPVVPIPRRRERINPITWILTHPEAAGPIFVLPWFIGFLAFTLLPFLSSIGLSFVHWSLLGSPRWVGLSNYTKLLTDDVRFNSALVNTVSYTLVTVPLKQVMALSIAVLLNQKLRGIYIYRTIFYLPSVTAGVATAILWSQIFGYRMGVLNSALNVVGIRSIPWLTSIQWALPTLMFISLWNVGSIFIIYLAGLQGVPTHFYEAAEVDGATPLQKFFKITLPLITPSIFFNVVMGFIGTFQIFTQAYIMTAGGPADRTLTYVMYLWFKGFQDFRMGYASALAWILFLIIMALTLLQLRLSRRWVYYEVVSPGAGG